LSLATTTFDVLLARAGDRIPWFAVRMKRSAGFPRVLWMETADLSSSARGFRFDRKSDGRLGKLRGRYKIGEPLSPRVSPVVVLQFWQIRADVSSLKLADFGELLALNNLDMLKAFRRLRL